MSPPPTSSPQGLAQLVSTSDAGQKSANSGVVAYAFGDFRLDVRRRRLLRANEPVPLPPKAIETLLALIEHRDRVVEKDELMHRLWSDTVVEEANLSQHVFTIRKALGEKPGEHRFIATAARRGYQFVAKVRPEEEIEAAAPELVRPARVPPPSLGRPGISLAAVAVIGVAIAGWTLWVRGTATSQEPIRAIAVLPFQNISGDAAQDYFADGITDAITTDLASVGGLRVVSRHSAMRFRNSKDSLASIGRQLGAEAIVQGTIARGGGRIRLTAQLVDVRTDVHLWAGSFDRRLGDVLMLQGELARAVARAVDVTLQEPERADLADRRPIDPEAYDLYLRGRRLFGQRSEQALRKSLEYYEQAIAREPTFANAHAGLALTRVPLGLAYDPPEKARQSIRAAAERALATDPGNIDAHLALISVTMDLEFDWKQSEQGYKGVIARSPSSAQARQWYGYLLAALGRYDEALVERERAVALDPLSSSYTTSLADTLALLGRPHDAMARYRQTLDLDPGFLRAHMGVAALHLARGDRASAVSQLEHAARVAGEDPLITAPLGHAYGLAGRRDAAHAILGRLTARAKAAYLSPVLLAQIHAGLDDRDLAMRELEEAYRQRSPLLVSAAIDPFLRPLHGDPRFEALLRRMDLLPR
jgi:TolB-like protein/DNA-binding winged helix-turn-helix (wHTH) protein/Tfp pilus assembly protein PilF